MVRKRAVRLLGVAAIAAGATLVPAAAAFAQAPDCAIASPSNGNCSGTDQRNDPGIGVEGAEASRSAGSGGGLPVTGGDAAALAAIGGGVLVVGGGMVMLSRRRTARA